MKKYTLLCLALTLFVLFCTSCKKDTDEKEGNTCPNTVSYEGQTYNTVQIGTQCWFKENLNVGTRIDGANNQTNNGTIEKYCYDDNPTNCTIYGGLYQWNEIMQYTGTHGLRGICPTGWHVPTDTEWTVLIDYLGGKFVAGDKMKETGTAHWIPPNSYATNESGFTGLPSGACRWSQWQDFANMSVYAYWWSSTDTSEVYAWTRKIPQSDGYAFRSHGDKDYGFSVRCIFD